MNTRRIQVPAPVSLVAVLFVGAAFTPNHAWAETKKKANPASKVYISDVAGEAVIDTGDSLEELGKRSVYTAQGAIIETKKPENEDDRSKNFSTMVYSNGTGAFFDADTRVEVKRFMQEPFTPNRSDVDVEPSISQTQAFVAKGTVGLCTSKLVAGSNMNYQTPLGSVNIRGKKVVIESNPNETKISMLEGDSTVRGGTADTGGYMVRAGEQAIIRRGADGQANQVEVRPIPASESAQLDDKVAMACMAKKTVYFEVKERTYSDRTSGAGGNDSGAGDGTSGGGSGNPSGGAVTAFDGTTGGASSVTIREIVPIEIIPTVLPTQFTVSPARIQPQPPGRGPGS